MKILYAEDIDLDFLLVKKLLKSHELTRAENGRNALTKFYTGIYDLVLLNLQMPVLDGIATTELIRELDQSTQIYMISSQYQKKDEAIKAGVDKFFEKPLNTDYFKQEIKKLDQVIKCYRN